MTLKGESKRCYQDLGLPDPYRPALGCIAMVDVEADLQSAVLQVYG